ncbi:hypothetical protein QWY85_20505 [Neolewinella lacunae]|uniref:Uncharacterized protein n=1 Tax=Neolewinella lacunae TaxID=1517758 RepID=A0A923PJU0_9BACT|nr:hypothetical protein [Neolewinella lacunae]MBC6993875.1 hypothetical protein [Neolewinella lacunae]MDN3637064.1 hypothetical protein [Neolewinella lacunae]
MNRIFYLLPLLCFAACVNPPDFPIEPVLTYEGINKNQIYQFTNGPLDSIIVHFSFTDGDGDLSLSSTTDSVDIFFTDSRLGIQTPFTLPLIPQEGTGNGISGDIFVTVINTSAICCIFNNRFCTEDPSFPVDTFSYAIQIRDRAGNLSNVIRTETIDILCLGQ